MSKTLKQVVEGDFRYPEIESECQRWLLKIEPLRKRTPEGEKVRFEDIEQLIIKITKRYNVQMQWISLTILKDEREWYTVSIKDSTTHEYIKTVYGMTLYELLSKVALFMFAYTRERN